jgi:hypothetical protein
LAIGDNMGIVLLKGYLKEPRITSNFKAHIYEIRE